MSDNDNFSSPAIGEDPDGIRPRRRVIGTPPPAAARTMLAERPAPPVIDEPALPEDLPDEAKAKRTERVVAGLFMLAFLAGAGFIAAYFIFPVHSVKRVLWSNLSLGSTMTVAFLALAIGAVLWVRNLMPQVEMTEERKPLRSYAEDREAFAKTFAEGAAASQFVKRPLLRRTLIAATVPLGLAPLILLRDLGPLPKTSLRHTAWTAGARMVIVGADDNPPRALKAADISSPGGILTVAPIGFQDDLDALARCTVLLVKMRPEELHMTPQQLNWTVDGIVAYSKICTHVGCPAALYEQQTHHILCPCHQSTFDATRAAKVIFGPAARPLPQLPIAIDSEGYLIATSDFHEPVGPGFWERG